MIEATHGSIDGAVIHVANASDRDPGARCSCSDPCSRTGRIPERGDVLESTRIESLVAGIEAGEVIGDDRPARAVHTRKGPAFDVEDLKGSRSVS